VERQHNLLEIPFRALNSPPYLHHSFLLPISKRQQCAAMSEATTTASPVVGDVPVANNSSNITFTIHEQATAYGSLYGMALLCIVVGSIRSLWFVQRQIRKKKLIEASITMKEAKKFPLTASCVLVGLYIFFK
ncbi:Intramembrane protease 2, partial [Toxocara canis]